MSTGWSLPKPEVRMRAHVWIPAAVAAGLMLTPPLDAG